MNRLSTMSIKLIIKLIKAYQVLISPLLAARCRYYPTCSQYGIDALRWYGLRGVWMALRRVISCHPWGGSGIDFVPLPLYRFKYTSTVQKHNKVCVCRHSYHYQLARRFDSILRDDEKIKN